MSLRFRIWSGLVTAGCCAAGLVACGKVSSGLELQGTYVASYREAQERLVLHPDGTFRQIVISASPAKTNEATGTWTYDIQDGYITFGGHYMSVLDGFGQVRTNFDQPSGGLAIFPVRRWFGGTRIEFGEALFYRKLKKNQASGRDLEGGR